MSILYIHLLATDGQAVHAIVLYYSGHIIIEYLDTMLKITLTKYPCDQTLIILMHIDRHGSCFYDHKKKKIN